MVKICKWNLIEMVKICKWNLISLVSTHASKISSKTKLNVNEIGNYNSCVLYNVISKITFHFN